MKIFSLVCVAGLTLVLACGGASTPDAVVRKAIDAVENGDGEALVGYLCSDDIEELSAQVEENVRVALNLPNTVADGAKVTPAGAPAMPPAASATASSAPASSKPAAGGPVTPAPK